MSAQQWVGGARVDPTLRARWPGYHAIVIATDDVDGGALQGVVADLFEAARAWATELGAECSPHVIRWQAAFRDFGVKPRVARPSVDALTRRAASEGGLPEINVLVDLYNAISILCQVPIGGEDLDAYAGPPRLVLATGEEAFLTASHSAPIVDHPEPGEPVWIDDVGVTCRRWNWRQTSRTAIRETSHRVGFIVDSLDAPHHADAHRAAAQLAGLLPNAIVRSVDC